MSLGVRGWVWWLVIALALPACGKKSKPTEDSSGIEHQGGIPVIPRGKVVLAAARGEKFLLEIEVGVSADQAVAFYRNRLAMERWAKLRIQKVSAGLWGIQAQRGMFTLIGRVKRLGRDRCSIGFERQIQAKRASWKPPVPRDVVTLGDRVSWEERVFDAGGSRVEIRGTSKDSSQALRKRIRAALKAAGWTLPEVKGSSDIRAERKRGEAVRTLRYILDPQPKGTQVRLQLALDELAAPKRPAAPSGPRPAVDAGTETPATATNLVPVPADLRLWTNKPPPAARRLSDQLLSVTFVRPCKRAAALRPEVIRRLEKKGFRIQPEAMVAGGLHTGSPRAITALRGKQLVVAMISREGSDCLVTLTVTTK